MLLRKGALRATTARGGVLERLSREEEAIMDEAKKEDPGFQELKRQIKQLEMQNRLMELNQQREIAKLRHAIALLNERLQFRKAAKDACIRTRSTAARACVQYPRTLSVPNAGYGTICTYDAKGPGRRTCGASVTVSHHRISIPIVEGTHDMAPPGTTPTSIGTPKQSRGEKQP